MADLLPATQDRPADGPRRAPVLDDALLEERKRRYGEFLRDTVRRGGIDICALLVC